MRSADRIGCQAGVVGIALVLGVTGLGAFPQAAGTSPAPASSAPLAGPLTFSLAAQLKTCNAHLMDSVERKLCQTRVVCAAMPGAAASTAEAMVRSQPGMPIEVSQAPLSSSDSACVIRGMQDTLKKRQELERLRDAGAPQIGMTLAEARETNWGPPDSAVHVDLPIGSTDEWIYGSGGVTKRLMFKDGVLVQVRR